MVSDHLSVEEERRRLAEERRRVKIEMLEDAARYLIRACPYSELAKLVPLHGFSRRVLRWRRDQMMAALIVLEKAVADLGSEQ